jgi:hypothetical protein
MTSMRTGQRPGRDPLPGERNAVRKSRGGGVSCAGDVEDHEPCAHLADRGLEQPEAIDLEAFEVPGRRSIGTRIHAQPPGGWGALAPLRRAPANFAADEAAVNETPASNRARLGRPDVPRLRRLAKASTRARMKQTSKPHSSFVPALGFDLLVLVGANGHRSDNQIP